MGTDPHSIALRHDTNLHFTHYRLETPPKVKDVPDNCVLTRYSISRLFAEFFLTAKFPKFGKFLVFWEVAENFVHLIALYCAFSSPILLFSLILSLIPIAI
jgi:uncharacterized protein Usg